jgi:hypothetical protein
MSEEYEVRLAREAYSAQFEKSRDFVPCKLASIGGSVQVSGRPGYVWCREYNAPQSMFQAWNSGVAEVEGNLVKVGFPDKITGQRRIIGIWDGIEGAVNLTATLAGALQTGPHRLTHQYPSEGSKGVDAVLIYEPATQWLKLTGNGTSLVVTVQALTYWYNGAWRHFPGGTLDLTSNVPGTASTVRQVLVYLDAVSGLLKTVDGTAVPSVGMIPIPKPDLPANGYGSAFVKLTNGQTSVVTATHVTHARGMLSENQNGLFVRRSGDTMTGALNIEGSADVPQLAVQANATQTDPFVQFLASSGSHVFSVDTDQVEMAVESGQFQVYVAAHHASQNARLVVRRSRGNRTTPTAVQSSDVLGQVYFGGYGTAYDDDGVVIEAVANQIWTGAAHGAKLNFYTTPDGATAKVLGLVLSAAGQLQSPVTGVNGGYLVGGDVQFYRSGTNEATIPDTLVVDSTPANAEVRIKTNNPVGSGTAISNLTFYDNTVIGFEFRAEFGQALAANRYGGFLARSDRDGNELPLRFFTTRTDGNISGGSIFIEAGMAAGATGRVGVGPYTANSQLVAMLSVRPDTFASGVVSPIASFEARVANGLAESGGYIGFRQFDAGNTVDTPDAARIAAIHEVASVATGNTGLSFWVSANAAAAAEAMRINRNGQVGIGIATGIAASAILELASTTRALIVTRMTTTQRDALTAANGMLIFNTSTSKFQGYNGSWVDLH